MRSWPIIFAVTLLTAGELAALPALGQTWVVIAPPGFDSRLRREIVTLAAQSRARARFVVADPVPSTTRSLRSTLTLELREESDLDSWTPEMGREGYHLVGTFPLGKGFQRIQLHASAPAGFHNGLRRIPELLRFSPGDLADIASSLAPPAKFVTQSPYAQETTVSIVDYPSFLERGIVEGFYGKPWSHKDRIEILRFQGVHGMNVYYYAPKDDPFHRQRWADPYPARDYQRLGELAQAARANFVEFCFAISPGLSMRYSSENDFLKLTAKLESVSKLGIQCFALFLDDVPPELQHAADREKFRTLAEAHASLINKLDDHLKSLSKGYRLVVTPTTYTNAWGSRDYIRELGASTHRNVPLVWTGIDTYAPTITSEQAREWGGLLKRPPLVWDNFPVNDATPWRPHLGPLVGRDPHLAGAVRGLIANPMIQARASLIPLATVADYLWNPGEYDPGRSHTQAVTAQYGNDGPRLLEAFLKTYADNFWDENLFTPLFYSRRQPLDVPAMDMRLQQLETSQSELVRQPRFRVLAAELAPFLRRTRSRLAEIATSPAFSRLADGKLALRENFDSMEAPRLARPPELGGDFGKWESVRPRSVSQKSQIMRGADYWKGPDDFSARAAFAWDKDFLYVGVDVLDRELYQPFEGRGIEDGDVFILTLQTAFRKNYSGTRPTGDEYRFFCSPGNFSDVAPSLFSYEDYLPPRNRPQDHAKAIRSAWRKTAHGYSGDIAIPASYFDAGVLKEGYEIGLGFAVQNVVSVPSRRGGRPALVKTVFISKENSLFPVYLGNPSSYPQLVLVQ